MARRSDHSREELREMALEAAERMVVEGGFASLSARKVAAAIGYTVGTLYLVFENIDDLVLQVNARTLDRLYERLARAQSEGRDGREGLLRLGQAYITFADEDPRRFAMIYEHRLAEGRELPAWYEKKITRVFAMVEAALEPLAATRSRKDIARAARVIWGGVHGICILALSERLGVAGVDSVQELTESLISNFLAGFSADANRR